MILRFEAGDNTQETEVPCDCTRELRFIDPFEYPGFKDTLQEFLINKGGFHKTKL
jgi:hypothetical protein